MPDQRRCCMCDKARAKELLDGLRLEGCTFGFNIYDADDKLFVIIRPQYDTMVNETPFITPPMVAVADLIIAAGSMRDALKDAVWLLDRMTECVKSLSREEYDARRDRITDALKSVGVYVPFTETPNVKS